MIQVTALALQTMILNKNNNLPISDWGLGQTVWQLVQCHLHGYLGHCLCLLTNNMSALPCLWGFDWKETIQGSEGEEEAWAWCQFHVKGEASITEWWCICKGPQIANKHGYLQPSWTAMLTVNHDSKHFLYNSPQQSSEVVIITTPTLQMIKPRLRDRKGSLQVRIWAHTQSGTRMKKLWSGESRQHGITLYNRNGPSNTAVTCDLWNWLVRWSHRGFNFV